MKVDVFLFVGSEREDYSGDPEVRTVKCGPSTVGSEHFRHTQL